MDLIISVVGFLALIVEGIRCQGVYGECVPFACAQTKFDDDLNTVIAQKIATSSL